MAHDPGRRCGLSRRVTPRTCCHLGGYRHVRRRFHHIRERDGNCKAEDSPALHNEDYGRLWFSQVATVSSVTDECTHIPTEVPDVQSHSDGCEDCLRIGSSWIHLRMCAVCGHVGCCDQSEHHHARQHHAAHPDHVLIRSLEPGEAWRYCWIDDLAFELEGVEALRPG